jgi:lysophospholipase L1-like esterase
MIRKLLVAAAALLLISRFAHAEVPWTFSNDTRYLAMGDSLASGYGAIPVTQGYAYRLYQEGTFDTLTNTIFADSGVPGAKSADVLNCQVPEAQIFQPTFVTISVGGNDLLQILGGANPTDVLTNFGTNLTTILATLRASLPSGAVIIIGNQYDIPEIDAVVPGAKDIILQFNAIIASAASTTGAQVADVFSAFQGRNGLLLIERHGAEAFEVHPTNAGYSVMAKAFAAAAPPRSH